MTNNDELALKLKAAAEMATPGELERGDGKHGGELLVYCDDALGSAVCEATSTYNSIPKLQRIINLTFIATANPANILALLAERDADKKRIADLQRQREDETQRANRADFEGYSRAMRELEPRTVSVKLPDEFYTIADNIRTQDNRITSEPMFCVYQKREIAVDSDCDYDRIVWVDEDGNEASEHKSARLELLHENFREPPDGWRRVAVKDVDDFVTCCFTERGCKDYLACNGHNLRLPFIYVKSGFRNAEYISIRNWLAGIKLEVGE